MSDESFEAIARFWETQNVRDLVLSSVHAERWNQDSKWGEQNHPDGTGGPVAEFEAGIVREECETAFAYNVGTFRHILLEEVYEALAESDPEKLQAELIQVAAVAVAWVEKLIRNNELKETV